MKPGRLFVSHLLNELRGMTRGKQYQITQQMRKDIEWWRLYLPEFKGTAIMWSLEEEKIDHEFATDACLVAAGGVRDNQYFRCRFPQWILDLPVNIAHLELWAVVIALKMWGHEMMGKIVKVKTDNEAVSIIINTGRSKDILLQKLLRELVWWMSKFQVRIKSVYLPGKFNRLPDILSRWHEGTVVQQQFYDMTKSMNMKRNIVLPHIFQFTHNW